MARWLNLSDLVAIEQLQTRGMQLDLERAVLWPHTPLIAAFAAHWPLSPIGAETIILYPPAGRGRALGFLQMRRRRNRPEMDVAFMAPSLDTKGDVVSIWYRLLAEASKQAGDTGSQRLFAHVISGNGTEEVFRQSGFSAFAHEDIYRLTEWPHHLKKSHLLRHQRAHDNWSLLRLYEQVTPRVVQIAEGMLSAEGQVGRMHDWSDQAHGTGYVLQIEGELAAAVRLQRGGSAYWLRLWLNPQGHACGETLLHGALSLLWAAPHRPIYCSVREYQSGLRGPLEDAGFNYLLTRSLLVKHTTVRVKEPAVKLVPALEKRPEPAASIAHHTE